MSFDYTTLITDRAASDSDALNALLKRPMSQWTEAEAAAFRAAALKGGYDYTDLNRVSACMEDLVARLNGAGYSVPGYRRVDIDRAATPSSRLPEGYTEVEYIQSSGTQYINTSFTPNSSTRVVMDLDVLDSSSAVFFGARTDTTQYNYSAWTLYGSQFRSDYCSNVSDQVSETATSITGRYSVDKNKNICTINGITLTNTTKTFSCAYPLYLLAINSAGTIGFPLKAKLYSCQIYDNGTLVRDYVPCISASAEVGLYDLVNDKFYGNAGTGTFTAGDAVEYDTSDSDTESLDPYTWYVSDAPTEPQLAQYRANVAAVQAVLTLPEAAGDVPVSLLTTEDANRLETVLWYVDYILTKLPVARRHCGVSVCGLRGVIA